MIIGALSPDHCSLYWQQKGYLVLVCVYEGGKRRVTMMSFLLTIGTKVMDPSNTQAYVTSKKIIWFLVFLVFLLIVQVEKKVYNQNAS